MLKYSGRCDAVEMHSLEDVESTENSISGKNGRFNTVREDVGRWFQWSTTGPTATSSSIALLQRTWQLDLGEYDQTIQCLRTACFY